MATFPVPHLERRTFQSLPDEGTLLTETELLHLLRDLLKPLGHITYAFSLALYELGEGDATEFLVQFHQEILEQAVLLLDAWHAHQPPPGRRRATPRADPTADEPWPGADEEAEEAADAPPPPRRRTRRAQDA